MATADARCGHCGERIEQQRDESRTYWVHESGDFTCGGMVATPIPDAVRHYAARQREVQDTLLMAMAFVRNPQAFDDEQVYQNIKAALAIAEKQA